MNLTFDKLYLVESNIFTTMLQYANHRMIGQKAQNDKSCFIWQNDGTVIL